MDIRSVILPPLHQGGDHPGGTCAVRQVVTYVWTVEPVTIEERVTISVQATFEVNVPIPVIVVTPTLIDLSSLTRPGQTMQVDVKMANHGLIAWQGVKISFEDHPTYELKPLIEDVGVIAANSEVIVPVLARYKGSAFSTAAAGIRKAATQSTGSPCNIYGQVSGYYPCGGRQVNNATTLQGSQTASQHRRLPMLRQSHCLSRLFPIRLLPRSPPTLQSCLAHNRPAHVILRNQIRVRLDRKIQLASGMRNSRRSTSATAQRLCSINPLLGAFKRIPMDRTR